MNGRNRTWGLWLAACLAMAFAPALVEGQAVALNAPSLYADVKAHTIGDVVEVIVSESNFGSNTAQTNTSTQSAAETAGEMTTGALSGLFPGMGGSIDMQNQYTGQAASTRRGTLNSRISVNVIDMLPNGNLVIEGTKSMEINSDYEIVTISGVVDPRQITADNTVLSSQIANAKIIYKGKGSVADGNNIGIIGRVLNWIF